MSSPKTSFTSWRRWNQRQDIPNSRAPGVYVLAKSVNLNAQVDLLDRRILYFGETCSSLVKRWNQFRDSAFGEKDGHSGGKSYKAMYPGETGEDLYVAAMPVTEGQIRNKHVRESFIRFLERKLILNYAMKFKERPECNKK